MPYSPAFAQRLFPSRTWYRECVVVLGAALLVALLAQLTVPMWPVPVTGQTLGVLLAGGLLGFRRGVWALVVYLGAGTCGLPVFAGGTAGLVVFAGPTGGYLIGFLGCAGVAGLLAEHGFLRSYWTAFLTMLAATVPVFVLGVSWLSFYVPGDRILWDGFVPFVPGALVKAAIAAAITSRSAR